MIVHPSEHIGFLFLSSYVIIARDHLANWNQFTVGLAVPVLGSRWPAVRAWVSRWRVYSMLRFLHHALRNVDPAAVLVASGKRLNPNHRVRRMVIELSDWCWTLAPLFDPAVAEAATRLGQQAGLTGGDLKVTVEAAQLKAASHAWRHGVRFAVVQPGVAGDDGTAADLVEEDLHDGSDINDWISDHPITVAVKALLPEWVRWHGEQAGLPEHLVERAVAVAAGGPRAASDCGTGLVM